MKKCKHLVRLPGGKTLCRVYKKHLGTILDHDKKTGEKVVCIQRELSPIDYLDCPFNTNKPLQK